MPKAAGAKRKRSREEEECACRAVREAARDQRQERTGGVLEELRCSSCWRKGAKGECAVAGVWGCVCVRIAVQPIAHLRNTSSSVAGPTMRSLV